MTRWPLCIARDLAVAVLVGSVYVAGSIMLAMLLAALLGVTLDEPFRLKGFAHHYWGSGVVPLLPAHSDRPAWPGSRGR